jgi:hypothetical protein
MKKLLILATILPIAMFVFGLQLVSEQPVNGPVVAEKSNKDNWLKTIFKSDSSNSQPNKPDSKSPDGKTAKTQVKKLASSNKPTPKDLKIDEFVTIDGKRYPQRVYRTMSIPNDPQADQWWVRNIDLDDAWDTPEGNHQTTLAVIDTGFALQHEELSGRFAVNGGESGATANENPSDLNCTDQAVPLNQSCNNIDDNADGVSDNEQGPTTEEHISTLNCTDQAVPLDKSCNMVDDDNNGFVDDYRGWDFVNGDRSPQAGEVDPEGEGTHHASYVTGVVAANRGNGKGIAGVSSSSKILPIQGLSDQGYGYTTSVGMAVRYAANRGADVISMSLGSDQSDDYLQDSILYAIKKGSIIVAASGNDGCDCISYPANYEEVVAVGASDSNNNRYSFSNYGANLDVMAPGAGFYTATWSPGDGVSAYASNIAGTSLATPVVSGQLAVLKTHMPTASPTELVAALTENTNRTGIGSAQPRSNTNGFGRVQVSRSINRLLNAYTPPLTYEFAPVSYGNTLDIETTSDDHAVRVYDCNVYGEYGTTPLYKISPSSGDNSYYTSSFAERAKAIQLGARSKFLAYTCVLFPHDTPSTVRMLDPNREF